MTDTLLLEQLIRTSGLKKCVIAEKLGLSAYGLQLKITNKNEFTASEIDMFCTILSVKALSMRERIFFAKKDDLKSSDDEE